MQHTLIALPLYPSANPNPKPYPRSHGMMVSQRMMSELMTFFDHNADGKLHYEEFCNELLGARREGEGCGHEGPRMYAGGRVCQGHVGDPDALPCRPSTAECCAPPDPSRPTKAPLSCMSGGANPNPTPNSRRVVTPLRMSMDPHSVV